MIRTTGELNHVACAHEAVYETRRVASLEHVTQALSIARASEARAAADLAAYRRPAYAPTGRMTATEARLPHELREAREVVDLIDAIRRVVAAGKTLRPADRQAVYTPYTPTR